MWYEMNALLYVQNSKFASETKKFFKLSCIYKGEKKI